MQAFLQACAADSVFDFAMLGKAENKQKQNLQSTNSTSMNENR